MLITDKFVFIHLFRTGGTSINNSFKGKMVGYHRPRSLIPKEYTSLPIVGNIRNPFDWYVDIYYHALNFHYPMKTSTFLNFILDFNKYSFKESIKRLLDTSWMTSQDKEKSLSHFVDSYNWNIKLTDNLPKLNALSGVNSIFGQIKEPRQKNYMSYYDDDLINLIMDKDRNYIKKFNYNKIK